MSNELESMKLWIAERLQETAQFSVIDAKYQFKGVSNFGANSHIYLERKDNSINSNNDKYLILASLEPFGNVDALTEKVRQLTESGIAVCPILYKSFNKGYFKSANAGLRLSMRGEDVERKKRAIETNKEERFWTNLTEGNLTYYNPNLKKIAIIDLTKRITADYVPHKELGLIPEKVPEHSVLITIRDPIIKNIYTTFSLDNILTTNTLATFSLDKTKNQNCLIASPIPAEVDKDIQIERLVKQLKKNYSDYSPHLNYSDKYSILERIAIMTERLSDREYEKIINPPEEQLNLGIKFRN